MNAKLTPNKDGATVLIEIEKSVLDRLHITSETSLEISEAGGSLVLTPSDPARREKFLKALADTNEKYGAMLQRLAK